MILTIFGVRVEIWTRLFHKHCHSVVSAISCCPQWYSQSLSDKPPSHRNRSSSCLSDVVPGILRASQFITFRPFHKVAKSDLLTLSCVTICPSARWTDRREILSWGGIFLNSSERFRIWLKSNQHNRQFTRRPTMCIYQSLFISPTDALYIYYIRIKIYIKIHIKNAPTCFGLTTILRENVVDLS